MAKDKDSKSEAIPGGTKASDLPPSVGGTKGTGEGDGPGVAGGSRESSPTPAAGPGVGPASSPTASPDFPAPVRTDAAASTPPAGRDFGAANRVGNDIPPAEGAPKPQRIPSGFTSIRKQLAGDEDPGSDVSVGALVGMFQAFVSDAKARNWAGLVRDGSDILGVFAHLMDSSGLFGTNLTDAQALANVDRIGSDLASCRESIATALQSGNHVSWGGEGFDPTSGSPPGLARLRADAAEAINPQTLLVLFELVQQIYNLFRSKTQAAPPPASQGRFGNPPATPPRPM